MERLGSRWREQCRKQPAHNPQPISQTPQLPLPPHTQLFCQNLSLFAKLFLDNKSVFFDVTGFKYYLLVHTPPSPPIDPDADVAPIIHPRGQIVGFFSK